MHFVNLYSFKKEDMDEIITVSFINTYELENYFKFWEDQSTACDL